MLIQMTIKQTIGLHLTTGSMIRDYLKINFSFQIWVCVRLLRDFNRPKVGVAVIWLRC